MEERRGDMWNLSLWGSMALHMQGTPRPQASIAKRNGAGAEAGQGQRDR